MTDIPCHLWLSSLELSTVLLALLELPLLFFYSSPWRLSSTTTLCARLLMVLCIIRCGCQPKLNLRRRRCLFRELTSRSLASQTRRVLATQSCHTRVKMMIRKNFILFLILIQKESALVPRCLGQSQCITFQVANAICSV